MPSLGFLELLVVGVVLLLVVGPQRLPHATRMLGRAYGQARRAADDLRRALVLEADRMDEEERLRELRKRRELAAQHNAAGEGGRAQPESYAPAPGDDDVSEDEDADAVPSGFSADEWAELPEHVRELVRERRASRS